MFLKIVFLWIYLLLTALCQGKTIQSHQAIVLEQFFRTMLLDSEGGYVLFDKKPVCIHGFTVIDEFRGENTNHRENVDLYIGSEEWNKLIVKNDNIIIHVKSKADNKATNYFHILFINKKLFLNVVKNNIALFQYILGPSTTPESLLEKLTNSNEPFHSVLNNNKVLIGIILGFGTKNSIYGSRLELIQELLQSTEHPPLRNILLENEKLKHFCKDFILFRKFTNIDLAHHLQPSFSYSSIKEEMDALMNQFEISSQKLSQKKPYFIFGKLINDEETKVLINELEETQDKINTLLSSNHFLNDVLTLIFPDEKIEIEINSSIKKEHAFTEKELKSLPRITAMNILANIQDIDNDFLEGIIFGMKDADTNLEKRFKNPLGSYDKQKILKNAEKNIQQADLYFLQLDQDKMLTSLIPKKLYYQCLEKGYGQELENHRKVLIHCKIENPKSLPIFDTWKNNEPIEINLNEAIPGFALGMQGMKIGEIREIFIHPSIGYGIYTFLDKGIYLKVQVKLINFDRNYLDTSPFSSTSLDFNDDLNLIKNNDYAEASKIEGYIRGYHLWSHYKKANLFSIDEILQNMNIDKFEEDEFKKNQHLLNRLHWHIYHN